MSLTAAEAVGRGEAVPQPAQAQDLCRAAAEGCPMPMAELEGATHLVRYVNPAFCSLSNKTKDDLTGSAFCAAGLAGDECIFLLDLVYRTGKPHIHIGQKQTSSHPFFWSYVVWPVLSFNNRTSGVMLQVTETARFHQDALAMNQALLMGSVRQHELTEAAELLATQLQAEIASRKKAEEALIGSEKLASVGRMAAVLAHEINNPIATVMDILYLVQGAEGLPKAVVDYLDTADGELKRIAHITRQTLGFYSEMFAPAPFKMCSLLESVLDLLKAKIKSKGASVVMQCDTELQVTAMQGELRQVFSNLLLNSLYAVGENGKVRIRASISLDPGNVYRRVRVTVSDNGHGIDAATLPQIFNPFFTTKGAVGNGLGLWVGRQIVDKHGGFIRVRTSTRGAYRGTSFSVVLPTKIV